MKFLKNFNFKNKRVLVRCDFNVPIKKGRILDDFRIKASLPTIKYLIKKKAKIILISHLGRPKGFKLKQYSLKPVAKNLEKLIGQKVKFLNNCLGEEIEKFIKQMEKGEIVLLENLRFYKEEEANNKKFAKQLSKLGDIYINDAFGSCHRKHASIVGISKFLPSGAGLLLEKEIKNLSNLVKNPKKPLTIIIGGAKIETKIKLAEKFLQNCDYLLIGGILANAIFKAKKITIGKSIINKEITSKSSLLTSKKVYLPIDVKISKKKNGQGPCIIKEINKVKKNEYIFDIGPQTQKLFKEKILKSQTIFWNGPLGLIEKKSFIKGTKEIAQAVVFSKAYKVIGGGDIINFLNKIKLLQKINHISTGGGAMLAFLSGEKLPGIIALRKGDTNYELHPNLQI